MTKQDIRDWAELIGAILIPAMLLSLTFLV